MFPTKAFHRYIRAAKPWYSIPSLALEGPPALSAQMAPLPLKFEGVPLLTTIGRELVIYSCKVTAVHQ